MIVRHSIIQLHRSVRGHSNMRSVVFERFIAYQRNRREEETMCEPAKYA